MKVAWFAEDLNNDKKVCNYVPPSIKYVNLELQAATFLSDSRQPDVDLLHF